MSEEELKLNADHRKFINEAFNVKEESKKVIKCLNRPLWRYLELVQIYARKFENEKEEDDKMILINYTYENLYKDDLSKWRDHRSEYMKF